ncbi:MAG: V4R domain-containing protein [Candidatus Micrarchaeia archaeon]
MVKIKNKKNKKESIRRLKNKKTDKKINKTVKKKAIILRNATKKLQNTNTKKINEINYNDLEEYLISKVISEQSPTEITSTNLSTIILNITSSLQKLSYKFGYSNGKSIFYNYNNINMLLKFLEASGFKSVLYYPHGDKNVIRCKSHSQKVKNYNLKLHYYEAGSIAGYLSGHIGKNINVVEDSCVYEGAEECIFSIYNYDLTEKTNPKTVKNPHLLISEEILKNKSQMTNNTYQLLSIMSLLRSSKIVDELSKLLYISGLELSKTNGINISNGFDVIGKYLGVNSIKIVKKVKNKKSIFIKYNNDDSLRQYILLTSNIFLGLAKGLSKKEIGASIDINKDSSYILKLNI